MARIEIRPWAFCAGSAPFNHGLAKMRYNATEDSWVCQFGGAAFKEHDELQPSVLYCGIRRKPVDMVRIVLHHGDMPA